MIDNFPPLPFAPAPETPKQTHTGYWLCGQRYVEVGPGFPDPDGQGVSVRCDIGIPDGTVLHVRAIDPTYYFGEAAVRQQRKGGPKLHYKK